MNDHNAYSTIQNCLLMVIVAGAWFADKIDSYTALGVLLFVGGLVALPAAINKRLPPGAAPVAMGSLGVASMVAKIFPHAAVLLCLSFATVACGHDAAPALNHTLLAAQQVYMALCPAAKASDPACVEAARALHVAAALQDEDAGI